MIICAALRLIPFENYPETIVPCHRHHNGYMILGKLMGHRRYLGHVEDGFMNHLGEFVDRHTAFKEAVACGQISASLWQYKHERNEISSIEEGVLYSEDLY